MDKGHIDTDETSSESEWEDVPEGNSLNEVDFFRARLDDYEKERKSNNLKDTAASNEDKKKPKNIQIFIPNSNGILGHKGKSREERLANIMVKEVNHAKRESFLDNHRAGLLCLLSRGLLYNKILCNESVLGAALSTIPSKRSYPPKKMNLEFINTFLTWFNRTFSSCRTNKIEEIDPPVCSLLESLLERIESKTPCSKTFIVFIFVAIFRSLGIQTRLVWNLTPPLIQPPSSDLMKLNKTEEKNADRNQKSEAVEPCCSKSVKHGHTSTDIKSTKSSQSFKRRKMSVKGSPYLDPNVNLSSESDTSSSDEPKRKKKSPVQGAARLKKSTLVEKKADSRKSKSRGESKGKYRKLAEAEEPGDKKSSQTKASTAVLSEGKINIPQNFWVEVYLEEEEVWVSVDIEEGKIHSNATLKAKASQPIAYVIAFSNTGYVRDVTRRYSDHWWIELRKLRDHEWWIKSLQPFWGPKTREDKVEEAFLKKSVVSLPIPNTVKALKNHPLYILPRHLLMYQAIYPGDVVPTGYVRGEPVYLRKFVQTLHGKDQWYRKARVVRIGENPYKEVKARRMRRANRYTPSNEKDTLELFGEWQTDPYEPPIAFNGKVPRNKYGSVDLYLPEMLPVGTVHLQLNGLSRVAGILDIDIAPALVGFEYNASGCFPKFDGSVVCEEFEEALTAAWRNDQEIIQKEIDSKRKKRIYQRWARLCKLILIRQKVELKYGINLSTPSVDSHQDKSKPST